MTKAKVSKHSKKHHYVPQGILRRFCFQNDTTWYLSRERFPGDPSPRNIGSIFCKRHFNSFQKEDGTKDDAVERFFGKEFDNYIPEWTAHLEVSQETNSPVAFGGAERRRFVQFFYNHMKRSPDFIEPIVAEATEETFAAESIEKLERQVRPLTDEERSKFQSTDFQRRVAGNSRVENFSKQSVKILETINEMSIALATPARANKQFIVGSNPVARFEDYPRQHLSEPGVELWTTLTPRLAVGFVHSSNVDNLRLSDHQVRKLNISIAKQSRAIASTSKELLASLARVGWPTSPKAPDPEGGCENRARPGGRVGRDA
ncbi:DUF4238 domain-containing protein [Shimia sp. FJ5]|uniref:DUF4238 domain-containing protein n=1 Tax=Shimia sp. FJ5 TaxID=3079054 RepID=UPI002628A1FE|nr:DUF4238 domain-containing protein [Shimia sp. FJ5]MDV4145255.1 DUF4238 domain-containing protein [Shimia sp. FJ5]